MGHSLLRMSVYAGLLLLLTLAAKAATELPGYDPRCVDYLSSTQDDLQLQVAEYACELRLKLASSKAKVYSSQLVFQPSARLILWDDQHQVISSLNCGSFRNCSKAMELLRNWGLIP